MHSPRVDWNEQALEILRAGWAAGEIAVEIARKIPGANKNCIIGKAHRLHLGEHVRSPKRNLTPEERAAIRALRPRKPRVARAPHPPRTPTRRRPLAEGSNLIAPDYVPMCARPWETRRRGECTWPFRVSAELTLSCCAPADGLFCEDHAAIAFNPAADRRDLERLARAA